MMNTRKIYDDLTSTFDPNEIEIVDNQRPVLTCSRQAMSLDMMPSEDRLPFALAHKNTINTKEEIQTVLEYIPRADRINYVNQMKDKIPGYFVWRIVALLSNECKLQFALSQLNKLKTKHDIDNILIYLSKEEQIVFASANFDKLNGPTEISKLNIHEDSKPRLLAEWEKAKGTQSFLFNSSNSCDESHILRENLKVLQAALQDIDFWKTYGITTTDKHSRKIIKHRPAGIAYYFKICDGIDFGSLNIRECEKIWNDIQNDVKKRLNEKMMTTDSELVEKNYLEVIHFYEAISNSNNKSLLKTKLSDKILGIINSSNINRSYK